MKKNIVIITISVITAVIVLFSGTYYLSKNKFLKEDEGDKQSTFSSGADVSEDINIILKSKDEKNGEFTEYKAYNFKDFKKTLNYTGKADKDTVVKFMKDRSYNLESINTKEMVFIKTSPKGLIKDKYYLGITQDGFICIYKCLENGELIIENKNSDISRRRAEVLQDFEKNKIKNHEFMFNTRDEALDALSEYDS
ncbi:hypothetical protein [Clostridium polynesiense]|uniref:hypothetical protein n=1 Tax=Clostridium polynesiense TaxID=1325933 RepID=UPI00058C4DA9|nr:hypothetical protein [Clostridium polynesiense]